MDSNSFDPAQRRGLAHRLRADGGMDEAYADGVVAPDGAAGVGVDVPGDVFKVSVVLDNLLTTNK